MDKSTFIKYILPPYLLFIAIWNIFYEGEWIKDFLNSIEKTLHTPQEISLLYAGFLFVKLLSFFAGSMVFYSSFSRRLKSIGLPKGLFFLTLLDDVIFPTILALICLIKKETKHRKESIQRDILEGRIPISISFEKKYFSQSNENISDRSINHIVLEHSDNVESASSYHHPRVVAKNSTITARIIHKRTNEQALSRNLLNIQCDDFGRIHSIQKYVFPHTKFQLKQRGFLRRSLNPHQQLLLKQHWQFHTKHATTTSTNTPPWAPPHPPSMPMATKPC